MLVIRNLLYTLILPQYFCQSKPIFQLNFCSLFTNAVYETDFFYRSCSCFLPKLLMYFYIIYKTKVGFANRR